MGLLGGQPLLHASIFLAIRTQRGKKPQAKPIVYNVPDEPPEEQRMADNLKKLLLYIVQHPVLQNEQREAELDATAVQDVAGEVRAIAQDHQDDANQRAPYFASGLKLATKGPVVVEDTDPEGNAIADAFARYLVAPDLATSQGEQLSEGHFRYTFEVDWPRLHEVARRAGVDLDSALKEGQ